MNWNKAYQNNRDYIWMPTQSLDRLLNEVGISPSKTHPYTALDIGCGTGQLVRDLYHKGFHVTGIDTSEVAVSIAKNSTTKTKGISFRNHDITKSPLNQTFDLITAKYVLAFIEDRESFLRNVSKSLNSSSDSAFVVITPNLEDLPEAKKHIGVDPVTLKPLLAAHFSRVDEVREGSDTWYICR